MDLKPGRFAFDKSRMTAALRRWKVALLQLVNLGRRKSSDVGGPDDSSRLAELTILPDTFAPRDIRSLVGLTRNRMGGAYAASLISHVVGTAMILLLISLAPERAWDANYDRTSYDGIIWIPEEGPGGGGGGGGNESLEVPRPVEVEGPDETELSVPVEPEPEALEPEPLDLSSLVIPALPMAAALETLPGSMDDILAARNSLSQGSGRGGGGGTGTGTGIGPGTGPGLGPGTGGGVGGGVYRPGGAGIENPMPLYRATPQYTSEAMRAQVQGEVWLEIVVLPDGTVGEVTITRSLDRVFGLDDEAIKAARRWRFRPGTRFGEPVAMLVGIALEFNLR